MSIVNPILQSYLDQHCSPQPPLLSEVEADTWKRNSNPAMISGAYQGRYLAMMSRLIQPKYILEIGSFTGFSALCLCEGLQADGKLISLEYGTEVLETYAKPNLKRSPYAQQVEFQQGYAAELIPELDYQFDLIFIDADKKNYLNYYHLCFDKLRRGGVILADNTLWSGRVYSEEEADVETQALRSYNDFVSNDERVQHIILPMRDGMGFTIKL